jgi:tetratricopeptide (TPR) repeat protein
MTPPETQLARMTRSACWIALAAVVIYATLAGFRTIDDFDVWWQMAAGRYIVQSGHVMRTDVFSYTAQGEPWIYPVGAGILFHWLYTLGGFVLLSLLSPLIGGAIAWLLVRRRGLLRCWLAALAVPAVAAATAVRANMFTTLLATVFLAVLWDTLDSDPEQPTGHAIWSLPPLMVLWANLHPGFIYGLALVTAATLLRPRRLLRCALLTLLATLVNPWTWRIYAGLLAQARVMSYHQEFINEWKRTPISWAVLQDALHWRESDSYIWWLMAVALVAVVAGLRKRPWGALLVLASGAAALAYTRFHWLAAVATAIVAPDLLSRARAPSFLLDRLSNRLKIPPLNGRGLNAAQYLPLAFAMLLLMMIAWRSSEYASDRYYHTHTVLARFGAGVSEWPPERAARFIEEHRLPRQLYEDYAMGGYFAWRLGPLAGKSGESPNGYPVFIDGRALPFGPELFFRQMQMSTDSPAGPDWQAALGGWNIRTVVISTERFTGYGGAHLYTFCKSDLFKLAYMDETAAIFVTTPDAAGWPALDCDSVQLTPPPESAPAAKRYHFWMNAGTLYYHLRRVPEALDAYDHARTIFDGDPSWYMDHAEALVHQGNLEEAEKDLRTSVGLRSAPANLHALADVIKSRGGDTEAMELFAAAAARAGANSWREWLSYAETAIAAGRPQEALQAIDRVIADGPVHGESEDAGRGLLVHCWTVKGKALLVQVRPNEAVAAMEQAARLATSDPSVRGEALLGEIDAYWQAGRHDEARRLLVEARAMGLRRIFPNAMRRLESEIQ